MLFLLYHKAFSLSQWYGACLSFVKPQVWSPASQKSASVVPTYNCSNQVAETRLRSSRSSFAIPSSRPAWITWNPIPKKKSGSQEENLHVKLVWKNPAMRRTVIGFPYLLHYHHFLKPFKTSPQCMPTVRGLSAQAASYVWLSRSHYEVAEFVFCFFLFFFSFIVSLWCGHCVDNLLCLRYWIFFFSSWRKPPKVSAGVELGISTDLVIAGTCG